MPSADWAGVLDDMERRVAAAELVLGGGGPPPAASELPAGLGALPPELRARAESVYARTADVELRLEAAMAAVSSAFRGQERPAPVYVDRSA